MSLDRRNFLKASLGGAAGLTAMPLLGGLAGCQHMPVSASSAAPTAVKRATALPVAKVTDRVSVISGAPGNVIVLNTGDGVLLVESGSVELAPSVQKSLGGAKVHILFNSHYHADQTGGNALFANAGAEIHAHTITRQWLAADYYVPAEDRWVKAPPKEAVPRVTFRGKGEMKAGAERVEFGYLLEAHTRGDAYVFFRDSNVLVAGDVVSPLRDPILDWFAGGWFGGRVDAMDDLVKLANDKTLVVPAYGKVMTCAELQAETDMMKKLYDLTADLVHHGHSAQDMMNDKVLDKVDRRFEDPYKFLYDVEKGFQAHYTNFGGNVV
ncbi:MAG TPA: MBL fold metallo-hydrolase [Steroidobacteraceae bacterium]|nr:MBL fold metallo-hydrolase [Steroidobacteraceae bacterium]